MKKYIVGVFIALLFIQGVTTWQGVRHDGTLAGDGSDDFPLQTEPLTGDVTQVRGAVATTIANDAVTYAKMQNVTTNMLLGRATAASGDMEEITLGTGLSFTGTTLNVSDSRLTVAALAADHAISSTTATEVTLGATIQAGTYVYTYYLIVQSATTSVGLMYGINFTGTAAVKKMTLHYPSTGTAAITGVADDVGVASGTIHGSHTVTDYSTTAPNMGHNGGVGAANADILVMIEGILIVTASGDLELWHGSETATSTTIKANSSLIITKTN